MVIKDFKDLQARLKNGPKRTVAVAAAADAEILRVIRILREEDLGDAILVGEEETLKQMCADAGIKDPVIVPAKNDEEAAAIATKLVHDGKADVLMKGLVNSSVFLHAVLDKETGLRSGKLLSHLAAFEIPGQNRLHFHTDGGMCLAPDFEQKEQILENALDALHKIGYDEPKVAILTANERVTPQMPATVDAAKLAEKNRNGEITGCILEGPIAFDVAYSKEAANHKHMESRISGETDLFLVPNIESGNMLGKSLLYGAHAHMAGVILGARNPIVLVSRADDATAKLNSLALACACL